MQHDPPHQAFVGATILITVAGAGLAACSGANPGTVDTLPATRSASVGPSFDALSPRDFVAVVDNPYFPRVAGMTWVYEGKTDEGLRRTETTVLPETFEVMGLKATVVANKDYLDGELTEDNLDFFIQDMQGNVWYLGEEVANYDGGRLHDHGGSWLAGDDGNIPGIVMLADPGAHRGASYLQEHLLDCPRDRAQVVTVDRQVNVPAGSFTNVVQTHDTSAVEVDLDEDKYYARGVGLVKTLDNTADDEFVLIEFSKG
jgi:hypothetical protein